MTNIPKTKQQLVDDNTRLRKALESMKRAIAVSEALNAKMLADISSVLEGCNTND